MAEQHIQQSPQSANAFSGLLDILVAPKEAIGYVDAKPKSFWLPLLLLLSVMITSFVIYELNVDVDFATQQNIEQFVKFTGEQPTAEQRQDLVASQGLSLMTLGMSVGIVLGFLLMAALSALYLFLASLMLAEEKINYGKWFAVAIWVSVPLVFESLIGIVRIFMLQGAIGFDKLSLLHLNTVLQLTPDTFAAALASAISLISLWVIGLTALAIRQLTASSWPMSIFVALLPSLVLLPLVAWLSVAFI